MRRSDDPDARRRPPRRFLMFVTWAMVLPALMFPACATRSRRAVLGNQWPDTEPVVNLGAYESIQKRPGQRSDIAVAVAISGGGMRAANFAAGALVGLERIPVRGAGGRPSNLLREVDYLSTVSGGGFTAAAYLSQLLHYLQSHPHDAEARDYSFEAGANTGRGTPGFAWKESLARNYQSSLIGSLFNPVTMGILDRGDFLEERLDRQLLGRPDGRSFNLSDVFVPPGATPRVPYWIANAAGFENGAIFPFTPDILEQYGVTAYWHKVRPHELPEGQPGDLPLSVGLKASASFPVAIPPTTLKSRTDPAHPHLHLMDGGVSDNLGVITASRLLRQDRAARKILILIDAYNGVAEPFSRVGKGPGMMRTALRTASISLDSAHQRSRNLVDLVSRDMGAATALIDFHRPLEEVENHRKNGGIPFLETARDSATKTEQTSPQSVQALFIQVLGVGTWLRVKPETQNLRWTPEFGPVVKF